MCLITNDKELTAEKDILVYKIIQIDNVSMYQDFQYEPNKLYRLRKKLEKKMAITSYTDEEYCIQKGFHSYRSLDDAYHMFHSEYMWFDSKKVVKFTIPKGAKYYKGDRGDIVSSSIRSGDLQEIK